MDKQIQIPLMHFKKAAKEEYSNWRKALPREFLQNMIDAKSSVVHFNMEGNVLTTIDEGKGMSLEDCEAKLLTMGGTDKTDQDVGGYGVAKQILYFAWPNWEIHSRNYKIIGTGCRYRIEENPTFVKGVVSKITIDEQFDISYVEDYLSSCEVHATVFVNGNEYEYATQKGRIFKDLGWGYLYKAKTIDGRKVSDSCLNVRVKGVHMFEIYVSDKLDCRLTLELKNNAREVLTSNRDGFKNPYRDELQNVVKEIVVNTKSALREDAECFHVTRFEGTGLTTVINKTEEKPVNRDQIEQAVALAKENLQVEKLQAIIQSPIQRLKPNLETFRSELSSTDRPTVLVKAMGGKIPKKFHPATWNMKTSSIMALWQLILRQVLIDNKVDCVFGIGIALDPEIMAEFRTNASVPYFLVNPTLWHYEPTLTKKWLLIQELKQRAIHEIAHFASGGDHNENFVATVHALDANTWKSEAIYKAFAKLRKIKFLA